MEDQELADHVAEMVAAQVAQQLQLLSVQGNDAAAAAPPATPSAASVKLPPFWLAAPEAWFSVAEAQFELRHVVDEKTRYYTFSPPCQRSRSVLSPTWWVARCPGTPTHR
jgi:hypothetical protein